MSLTRICTPENSARSQSGPDDIFNYINLSGDPTHRTVITASMKRQDGTSSSAEDVDDNDSEAEAERNSSKSGNFIDADRQSLS